MRATSSYQLLKIYLVDAFRLSRDGFHIFIGIFVLLLSSLIMKRKLSDARVLIPPLLFAVFLEILDTRDALAYGFPVDAGDSLKDIFYTMFAPVVLWFYARCIQKQ